MHVPRARAARFILLSVGLTVGAFRAAPAATGPVPATFFAVSPIRVGDFPPVPMGTIGHPGFAWAMIESVKDSFDFSALDVYVAEAVDRGFYRPATNVVEIAVTLGLTPRWAVADTTTCTHSAPNGSTQCSGPPDSLAYWSRFLTALLKHYDGTAHPHLRYYELWNEADDTGWWSGTQAQMLQLAQIAYPIVHQDPYSVLLTPSVTGKVSRMTSWMSSYLLSGGAAYADGGAFHGYLGQSAVPYPMPEDSTSYGSILEKVTEMRAVFDTSGLAGKPMYQTEGSWGSFNVTNPDSMVAWLARFELLQAGLRSTDDLRVANWFCWGDSAFGWGDLQSRAGTPNAAGIAYEQVYNWVVGATIASPCAMGADSTWTCTMTRPGGYVGLAVWNSHPGRTVTPGAGFTRYRDLAGNTTAIAPGASVPVPFKPILIEQGTVTNAVALSGPPAIRLRALPSVTRSATRVLLAAPAATPAWLRVHDVSGRLIRTLAVPAGAISVAWDGRDTRGDPVGSGLYLLDLDEGGARGRSRVTIVR